MSQPQVTLRKQQGTLDILCHSISRLTCFLELQQQYTNYKNNLQQLAQRIGEIENDAEEHKYGSCCLSYDLDILSSRQVLRHALSISSTEFISQIGPGYPRST